jgi:phospholipase C
MESRRDFLKKAALLAAAGGLAGVLPASIQRAFAIDPMPGSTYLDAEHIVILMQENRSFDHTYGKLRGVRGFNDPRAMTLPNGNPVWLQSNADGDTYGPFRLNIKDTKVTWMGSLPHGWVDQGGARNDGKHDRWLEFKHLHDKELAHFPLTLGYYEREDLPFFYAFADAFTVCDQNFCSSLTATIPNRLHLWTGTVRAEQNGSARANILNEYLDYDSEVTWKTFPERLEEAGISWRVYQNELSLPTGLEGEADSLLTNFGDNVFEWFTQYRVRFLDSYRNSLLTKENTLNTALAVLEAPTQPASEAHTKEISVKRAELKKVRHDLEAWSEENFSRLSPYEQNLHLKAFTTNAGHADYRELSTMTYHDGDQEHKMPVPKGDLLHQFREDVTSGKLPTVSWIVPPERFSDHPCSPWYGAWYLSETLDILTQNPEIWKKTIFILCYDENDGYFDHVPPFVPPTPGQPETGKVSAGIDVSLEHVSEEQQQEIRQKDLDWAGRAGPIGLGFRVPLVIASPWSRGGYACSQVFDHTSILQFLENFLSHKTGQPVRETNINEWRRTVCGDLTSVFRPYQGEKILLPTPVERESFFGLISQAQFRPAPNDFKKFSAEEIAQVRISPNSSPWLPQQEKGIRPACALPYELAVDGRLSADRKSFTINFAAGREQFGGRAAGAPFRVYVPTKVRARDGGFEIGRTWDYAVAAGDLISDSWSLGDFENGIYHLRVHGPNGFYREFRGTAENPIVELTLKIVYQADKASGEGVLSLSNCDPQRPLNVMVDDLAYGASQRTISLNPSIASGSKTDVVLKLNQSFGWYDFRAHVEGVPEFERRYAGHIEAGKESFTDPFMGRIQT